MQEHVTRVASGEGSSARAVDLHQLQGRPPGAAGSPPARPRRHRSQNRRCSPGPVGASGRSEKGTGEGRLPQSAGTGRRNNVVGKERAMGGVALAEAGGVAAGARLLGKGLEQSLS